jgi:MFS family permease
LSSPSPPGRLRTTRSGLVAGWALTGLVLGRLLRPLLGELDRTAPRVGWAQVLALYLVAVILGAVAWSTRRTLQRERPPERLARLEPHQAVNRLVLAKACALARAVVCGGYLGYALSWVGDEAELGTERIVMSLAAAAGAALTTVASLLLERACRIREEEDET